MDMWNSLSACMLSWASSSQLYSESCKCLEHPVDAPHECVPGTAYTNASWATVFNILTLFQFSTANIEVPLNKIHFLSHTSIYSSVTFTHQPFQSLQTISDTKRKLPPTCNTLGMPSLKSCHASTWIKQKDLFPVAIVMHTTCIRHRRLPKIHSGQGATHANYTLLGKGMRCIAVLGLLFCLCFCCCFKYLYIFCISLH